MDINRIYGSDDRFGQESLISNSTSQSCNDIRLARKCLNQMSNINSKYHCAKNQVGLRSKVNKI